MDTDRRPKRRVEGGRRRAGVAEALNGLAPHGLTDAVVPLPPCGPASAEPAMIVVHHLNNSRSQRVLWLLE